ncbi:MD-2-related lipid-recognition domain [Lasallia pustulata]|uniref:Phosphatidylglycerol/phosphatidylinositol transfer protein n=1 Tax=Lasallia pustulata TaxID=136370 RepID=A0A1W5DA47_9LECA|nr:MD-2-related lipid-recognition domain [Lasallia pustulata]
MYQLLTAAILSFLIAFTHFTSSFALVNQIQNPLDDAHGLIHSVNSTGTTVPGSSPVRYGRDPLHNLFTISQLDMHPNPCVIESYCSITALGNFTADVASAHLSFKVVTRFDDGREGLMCGEDNFCKWVEVVQNGTKRCPPEKGHARLQWTVMLVGGWIPEANYTITVLVTTPEGETVSDLWTEFEMRYKD